MVRTIMIQGVPHAYELTAPAPSPHVLVFVHGWLLSRGYWQPIIQRLSAEYQCLSYDLRGFGDSHAHAQPLVTSGVGAAAVSAGPAGAWGQRPKGPVMRHDDSRYTPAAYAQDLKLLLQQLNISSAWLVGHSLGGSIALWAAHLAPQSIKGVVCVNSGGGIYLKEEFERFRTAGQQLVKLRPRWLCQVPLMDVMMARMSVARPLSRRWGRQRLIDLVMAHPDAALGTLLDSTTEIEVHRLPELISRLQQPVHFIAGTKDTIMEPQYVRHLASFHPLFSRCGENVTEIPNCGHMSMVEQPDAVADHVRAVLTQHSDVAAS